MARNLRQDIEASAEGRDPDAPDDKLQEYLDCLAQYDKEFEKWCKRVEKIIKRYRDDSTERRTGGEAKFNILWSNVQTLVPACFSKLPVPDVSRRFKDQDPTGRVAAMLLERGLDFEITHYTDYRSTLRQCVYDRFLGGRGTAWVRYEPHFKGVGKEGPDDGVQVTEDTDESPLDEAIDYECAPIDYVHWRDFGHNVARTWEEVTKVWRNVYMGDEAVRERFPKDKFPDLYEGDKVKIPFDASPEMLNKADKTAEATYKKQALVIELWNKETGTVCWFSKSMKKILDERDDPLGLQDFFPCPRPLYSTLSNESLIPVPDFTLYQDQARELDVLADRIDGLAKMLQLKGVYDASVPALARLFTEGENGTLIPVKDWAKFSEKGGLKSGFETQDLMPIAEALRIAAETMEQVKEQVYEITGISDIIRGQTQASETATAQNIKGQYASLRLRSMQDEVARFATELLQLKAQVICGKFSPETIAAISAADQLSDEDKPRVFVEQPAPPPLPGQPPMPPLPPIPAGPAMALLIGEERIQDPAADAPNPMRSFRIEVAADTLVQLDEQKEKQDRMEFVTTVGQYLEKALPVVQQAPQAGPLVLELLKFGVRGFKVGKSIEGQFDSAVDALKKQAQQPPPPDPEQQKVQAEQQAEQQRMQMEAARNQAEQQAEAQRMQMEAMFREREQQQAAALEHQKMAFEGQLEMQRQREEAAFARFEAILKAKTAVEVAEIGAKATIDAGQIAGANEATRQ